MAQLCKEIDSLDILSFPYTFQRLNGRPLVRDEVWVDLNAMQAFAASNAAYVGQRLVFCPEEPTPMLRIFTILDTEGNLLEIATLPMIQPLSTRIKTLEDQTLDSRIKTLEDQTLDSRINIIEDDYLQLEDKTELEQAIATLHVWSDYL